MSDFKVIKTLLRKVELNNDGSATVTYKRYSRDQETGNLRPENINVPGKADEHGNGKVHEDLRNAFKPFMEHWMIRGNEVPEPKGNYPFDESLKGLDTVTVRILTWSGGEPAETEGDDANPISVHITGTRKLTGGGTKSFCLPGIKLSAPQEKYKFQAQLDGHVGTLEAEAFAYVGGKCAPAEQLALALDGEGTSEGGEDDPQLTQIGAPAGVEEEIDEEPE